MDWGLIEQKLESLRRSVRRVQEKCPENAAAIANNYDAQDILSLNISRAVQMCVDIGTHLIAGTEYASPVTMGQTFDILCNAGIISADLAARMKKAVGFRNIAIHNYESINWTIFFAIASAQLQDFEEFAKAITSIMGGQNDVQV